MTLLQLRTLWRKQVRDTQKVAWPDDADADAIINLAYYNIQKEVYKLFPTAHLFWDYIPTQATVSWYPLPSTFGVKRVGLKAASTDTAWTKLARKSYDDIVSLSPSTRDSYYAQEGQWIGVFPAPVNSVSNGIELIHTPIQSLSTNADVPRLKLPLHYAIVLWAKLIALGDTEEDSDITRARLQEILGDLGNWYELHSDTPDQIHVSL